MIEILLATLNGEKYIAAQIDSLLSQTHTAWSLLIHDDGSTDRTIEIINQYHQRFPDKIKIVQDNIATGSARNNFAHLMALSRAPYIMFCDQDDVWLANKIEMTHQAMLQTEAELGAHRPIGLFTDYKVVDDQLMSIADSGWNFQRNGPESCNNIKHLAVRNCITGCTLMVNRPAIDVAMPIPAEAIMHDWWLGLCILKHGGRLVPLYSPTVLYRQHGGNSVGITRYHLFYFVRRIMQLNQTVQDIRSIYRMARQCGAVDSLSDFLKHKINALAETIR